MTFKFSQLPYDVHLSILSYARPLDVLAVRKTCRVLAEVSRDRSLWIHALERMCLENALFQPSFDTDHMSVQELEHACLGPERWEQLMIKNASAISPVPGKKIMFRTPPGQVFKKIRTVPGGRYMVALVQGVQDHLLTYLTLWDLSNIVAGSIQSPIASIRVDEYLLSFTLHQSRDGRRLRVLTRKRTFSGQKYTVFEVTPGEEFHVLGTLWAKEGGFTSVYQDMLILGPGPRVTVWNFVEDKGVSWELEFPMRLSQMMVENDTVTLIIPHIAYVFKIPPLHLSAAELAEKERDHNILEPSVVFRFLPQNPNRPEVQECNAICDWYTGNPQPILFDFPDRDNSYQHIRFQLIFPSSNTLDGFHVSQLCSYSIPDSRGDNSHSPYRLCGDNVVLWWTTSDQVRCTVGRKDASHSDLIASNILLVGDVPYLDYKQHSLCPVSGRFMWIDPMDSEMCFIKDFEPGMEHQQEPLGDPVQDSESTETEDAAVFIHVISG